MLKIEKVNNGEEIRKAFSENFLLTWKEFKTDFNEEIRLVTGKGFSLSSADFHLYDMIAISKETTFEAAIKRLKAKEGDVYFMSEKETFIDCEGIEFQGELYKGGVFKANSKELAETIEREWNQAEAGECEGKTLPFDLYVFDENMKKAIVFTGDMAEYEDEEEGVVIEKNTRLCFSCKRRRGV